VLGDGGGVGTIGGVTIHPNEPVTAALTVQAPAGALPGDRFRIDVLQRRDGRIVGGSSYVLAVYEPGRPEKPAEAQEPAVAEAEEVPA
jgi:hypothetical protein